MGTAAVETDGKPGTDFSNPPKTVGNNGSDEKVVPKIPCPQDLGSLCSEAPFCPAEPTCDNQIIYKQTKALERKLDARRNGHSEQPGPDGNLRPGGRWSLKEQEHSLDVRARRNGHNGSSHF